MDSASLNLYGELFKTIGMLFIVLGFFAVILYIVKKISMLKSGVGDKSGIKLISSFYLGNKEKLIIVQVEKERFLLGLTPGNISMLSKLPCPEDLKQNEAAEKKDFPAMFKNNLKKAFFEKEERNK